ncbi:MAG TPA: hypothetical protein VF598_01685 [Hymenobacter sp.]|jgi:hypothetical protein
MADNEGRIAHGMTFEYRVKGSSGTYTKLLLLTTLEDGGDTTGQVDWSHAESPGATKQYKAGWLTPNEYSGEAHYTFDGYAGLKAAQESRATLDIKATVPAGPNDESGFVDAYDGYIASCDKSMDATSDDAIGISFAVQRSGLITTTEVVAT